VAVDLRRALPQYVMGTESSHGFKGRVDQHLERRGTASYHSWLLQTLEFKTGSSGVYWWGGTHALVLLLFLPRQPPMASCGWKPVQTKHRNHHAASIKLLHLCLGFPRWQHAHAVVLVGSFQRAFRTGVHIRDRFAVGDLNTAHTNSCACPKTTSEASDLLELLHVCKS